jgi:hypothetical protein
VEDTIPADALELPTPFKFELLAAGTDPLVSDDSIAELVATLWIVAGWPCPEFPELGILGVPYVGFALARPGQDKSASKARAHAIPRPAVAIGLSVNFKSS